MNGPRVSVGMPVYNGEEFLVEAIEGVLSQDFVDLELIISDNASADATLEISRRYAAQDPRVRILTTDVNKGLAWNFNRVFHASDSEFFMWNAADDVRRPSMVSACVAALDADPEAVLAYTGVIYIDEHSEVVRHWPRTRRATGRTPAECFGAAVPNERECFPAHRVIRSPARRCTAATPAPTTLCWRSLRCVAASSRSTRTCSCGAQPRFCRRPSGAARRCPRGATPPDGVATGRVRVTGVGASG